MYVSNLYTRLCFCIELYFNMLQVDVDDAWKLVGCLDTHLERIVFVFYHFIIHVVVPCFKTLYLIL
ncbi:hypothetical protein Hanom_Chr17g01549561 [Helianthus anomalus]